MVEARVASIEQSLDRLQSQMTAQLGQMNLSEAGHQQIHREVQNMAAEIQNLKSQGAREYKNSHPDKSLQPGSYSLNKTLWPVWSLRFKRYMNRKHPNLKPKMDKIEGIPSPLTKEAIAAMEVDEEISDDIIDHLISNCDGEAGIIARGAQHEHALEIWRRLAAASDPQGAFTELRDTRQVTKPQRCSKLSELPTHLATFEDRLLKITTRTGISP